MGASSNGFTFQAVLAEAKKPQQLDVPDNLDPQTSSIALKASAKNKGVLYVGFSEAEAAENEGYELSIGEAVSIDIGTFGRIWFNGPNAGDKLCVLGVGP